MNSSMEQQILTDRQSKGLNEEQNYRLGRLRALLKDAYWRYRWLDKIIERKKDSKKKKHTKYPNQAAKLHRRQVVLGQRIDELEDAIESMRAA